jgi:predicted RNase H-like nuclease (RuvC/YqgF family)
MTQAVRDIILGPLLEFYPPPHHLRDNEPACLRALAAYETALARFDRPTLEQAWEKVVAEQTYWVWPTPATIAEACRQCESKPPPPSEEEQRQAQARAMAETYASRYMKTSHVAKIAKREGWADPLRAYVHDVAAVIAQLICKVEHIGWNVKLADGVGQFHSSAEAFERYRRTPAIAHAVERGQIRVHVPATCIREWKGSGQHQARQPVQQLQNHGH